MHMADALLSPSVGVGFCVLSAGAVSYAASRLERSVEERHVPLMGVLGAFVFAAQMINFTIPGTGSSGHLIGGVLLAVLLGGHAALVTMASVLIIQSLFFADGGLLALGTNIFNMGVYPCLLGGALVRALSGSNPGRARAAVAVVVAAVVCLELGAVSVAAQTVLSGKSDLGFGRFAGLLMAIHLPIGVGEGVLTWMALGLIRRLYPLSRLGMAEGRIEERPGRSAVSALLSLGLAAAILAGFLSWFASTKPDGLEWSLARAIPAWKSETMRGTGEGGALPSDSWIEGVAPMAGYTFGPEKGAPGEKWPAVDPGRSVAGIVGGLLSLGLAAIAGGTIFWVRKKGLGPKGGGR